MECCKKTPQHNQKENHATQQQENGRGLKHLLMMLACCLAPIGILLLFNISGYTGAANYLVFLLCPLLHILMMKGMLHKKKESTSEYETK
ncbi:DUF2933 domain-containing protein [Anaerosinus massiliensis]|uniref:DUF2933 domain-containing protein n=1 Tax=Massilibacillus massiliensis TaxID=1806837 RepID=UPI0018FE209A|nr:DUF2933 domain-containing protein [Massilibacillus massiliensis]